MEKQYIQVMIESLQKKEIILDDILTKNREQTELLKNDDMSWDEFDVTADEKLVLIDRLQRIDEGFESLFEKVRECLQSPDGQKVYKNEICIMQQLISSITEKSVSIQAEESRNKQLVEQYFRKSRDKIKSGRTSSKAAMDYYKTMRQMNNVTPQFLDHKK